MLYGFGWFNQRISRPRNLRLKHQAFNLDALTGEIVNNGVAHHIEYDKSQTDDDKLIWLRARTNLGIIRDPPRQKYFAGPIDFSGSPGAVEDMNTLRSAKEAFKKGEHAPHWGDKSHTWYDPEAIRRFYWRKEMVRIHGVNWLSSAQSNSPPPNTFQPQEYLDAL